MSILRLISSNIFIDSKTEQSRCTILFPLRGKATFDLCRKIFCCSDAPFENIDISPTRQWPRLNFCLIVALFSTFRSKNSLSDFCFCGKKNHGKYLHWFFFAINGNDKVIHIDGRWLLVKY